MENAYCSVDNSAFLPVCVSTGLPQVLSVEADRKRVTLTRKKTLLESTLPVVGSYVDARRGLVAHGFIVAIKNFGCIVRFYNNVKGLVPLRELSSETLINPEELFYVGQVRRVPPPLLCIFVLLIQKDHAHIHTSHLTCLS